MFQGDISAVSFEKNPAENFKLPHSFKSDFATLVKTSLSATFQLPRGNQPLRGRLHKAAARPQRRGKRLEALKFKEIHTSAPPTTDLSQ